MYTLFILVECTSVQEHCQWASAKNSYNLLNLHSDFH